MMYRASDRGRLVALREPRGAGEPYRTSWRRDFARLTHSSAFRRLQGKTQLFPSHESDFFRNRLTHSLEVAQIAKSIAIRLNATEAFLSAAKRKIDTDLVELAALAHDLGHPPFGHNGEAALDECMGDSGGFEGNGQTLRILAKLEKRETLHFHDGEPNPVKDGLDARAGLNLAYRSLASVLKYDREIPRTKRERTGNVDEPVKGYHYTEAALVARIKEAVVPGWDATEPFKTVECSIMDVADDIAYSTYDLEDAFKAGFLSPLTMLTADRGVVEKVAKKIEERLATYYPNAAPTEKKFSPSDVQSVLLELFLRAFEPPADETFQQHIKLLKGATRSSDLEVSLAMAAFASHVAGKSQKISGNGYYRARLTSDLVGMFISGVQFQPNNNFPALSRVCLDINTFKKVEVLKNFAFQSLIMSPMLKVTEHRGKDIVKIIFEAIVKDPLLLPEDYRRLHAALREPDEKKRVVCDFIAGMTDRYAIQFYARLFGTSPETIYSPL